MVIQKVINNNVISAYDVNQQEIVIMGKGIGFKAHTGELIDESKIEKVFRIENENLSRQFQELLENIPLEHMQLTSDIISYAIKNLNVQLNQNIYITLTDHINFAILGRRDVCRCNMGFRYVYVWILPMYDVRCSGCSSCYDSDG